MEDISPQALALAQEGAPRFVQSVQKAAAEGRKRKASPTILVLLDAFYDDPVLLYACLWYAYSCQVEVTFCPPTRRTPGDRPGAK